MSINKIESERTRSHHSSYLDLKYGKNILQSIDILPPNTKALRYYFFHGAYWKTLDKKLLFCSRILF